MAGNTAQALAPTSSSRASAAAGNWVVTSFLDLIAAINLANQAGGANTIVLAGGRTFT